MSNRFEFFADGLEWIKNAFSRGDVENVAHRAVDNVPPYMSGGGMVGPRTDGRPGQARYFTETQWVQMTKTQGDATDELIRSAGKGDIVIIRTPEEAAAVAAQQRLADAQARVHERQANVIKLGPVEIPTRFAWAASILGLLTVAANPGNDGMSNGGQVLASGLKSVGISTSSLGPVGEYVDATVDARVGEAEAGRDVALEREAGLAAVRDGRSAVLSGEAGSIPTDTVTLRAARTNLDAYFNNNSINADASVVQTVQRRLMGALNSAAASDGSRGGSAVITPVEAGFFATSFSSILQDSGLDRATEDMIRRDWGLAASGVESREQVGRQMVSRLNGIELDF